MTKLSAYSKKQPASVQIQRIETIRPIRTDIIQ